MAYGLKKNSLLSKAAGRESRPLALNEKRIICKRCGLPAEALCVGGALSSFLLRIKLRRITICDLFEKCFLAYFLSCGLIILYCHSLVNSKSIFFSKMLKNRLFRPIFELCSLIFDCFISPCRLYWMQFGLCQFSSPGMRFVFTRHARERCR